MMMGPGGMAARRNRDALALTAGQGSHRVRRDRVVLLWQMHNEGSSALAIRAASVISGNSGLSRRRRVCPAR